MILVILIIAVIILAVKIYNIKKVNNELMQRIIQLNELIKDLYAKSFYNYKMINQINNVNMTDQQQQNKAVQNKASVQTPAPKQSVNPYSKSENIPQMSEHKNYGISNATHSVSAINKQKSVKSDTTRVPDTVIPPAPVIEKSNPDISDKPFQTIQNTHVPENAHLKDETKIEEKPQVKSVENWLGTRLFNIAASLMIFIGLILFCTVSNEYITNTVKMAAMFIVSGGFIALGAFFTHQNRSIFSLGLTGCGFGTFFISILLSHVYFCAIQDIIAFVLLLLWTMLALYMSKKLDSVMLSVTAHMGTAVSVCYAVSSGISAYQIILPVVYQITAIAVLIIGNIFCCKKTRRLGLFMSLCLLDYTSAAMCVKFSDTSTMYGGFSVISTAVVFFIQFLAISFISYLISISTASLRNDKEYFNNVMKFAHIGNKILWLFGIIASVGCSVYIIVRNTFGISSVVYPSIAIAAVAVGHVLVTLLINEKLNFNDMLSKLSIMFNSFIVIVSLFVQAAARETLHGFPFAFIYVGFLMLIIQYTKNKNLNGAVSLLIGCEMIFMCLYGYFASANVIISIFYMIAVGIEILLHWFLQSGESRESNFNYFKIAEYIWLSASVIPINFSQFSDISVPLILGEFSLINIIAYLCKYGRENEPELRKLIKLESLTTVYFGLFAVTFNIFNVLCDNLAIKVVFIILLVVLTALYARDFAKSNSTMLQVISSLTISGVVTALICAFFDSPFMYPIAKAYIEILNFKPFVLISLLILISMYRYNKNHKLRPYIWTAIISDMLLMSFFGYNDLIYAYDNNIISHILSIAYCAAHAIVISMILYCLWKFQSNDKKSDIYIPIRILTYLWVNFSISIISFCSFANMANGLEIVFAVLTAVNIIFYALNYQRSNSIILNIVIKIISVIIFYISIFIMSKYISVNLINLYIVRIALILLSAGLYYLIAKELLKSGSVILEVFVGLTSTIFVNAVCRGLSPFFIISYIFSIITMIISLICIFVGFVSRTKGLRIYGLTVVMLCIIKLVTVDISDTDSLSRVVAFVIGGIVCFIISGIYNKAESKFNLSKQTTSGNINSKV